MTYCIAVSLKDGLVLTSDSRTNAGIDNVSIYGKMHPFCTASDRKIVLLSAGNLATTQAVIDQLKRDMKEETEVNLDTVNYLSEAAAYLGRISVEKQRRHVDAGQSSFNPSATFILAGQIGQEPHGAYLIYPEGNCITTSRQTPYLQIGENKYGKPVLDRFLKIDTALHEAGRCCLISMDSTMRSNASVGAPVELLIYHRDTLTLDEYYCFQEDNEYLSKIRKMWHEKLKEAFATLPQFSKEDSRPLPGCI
ncbi:peptidase [Methylomonas sp. BW4-1]|uniref:Peptidase n=1 Tax=Methylomonas defluvii TaxID=3045149 RepID=A0ABU4U9F3_9GAMM|nr:MULTISPECIES: peptidase [unclassified Methylomonas]MDX8126050.1 peptidase [Methylomonas sp. OY6]NOV31188.1 peptidase [Methylomonas sp. ZR1]PKD41299.1 peptidase [Methylomonas sp. Kb3]QBC26142.1 peptidase [Methylomonas sp. LW13]